MPDSPLSGNPRWEILRNCRHLFPYRVWNDCPSSTGTQAIAIERHRHCIRMVWRGVKLSSGLHCVPELLHQYATTIVVAKAAICGWPGQIAFARPDNHAPTPTKVAIRVAARVLFTEPFIRSDVPQFQLRSTPQCCSPDVVQCSRCAPIIHQSTDTPNVKCMTCSMADVTCIV